MGQPIKDLTRAWLGTLNQVTLATIATDGAANPCSLDEAVHRLRVSAKACVGRDGRFILFGNGGSLAIASHIATDYMLVRLALNCAHRRGCAHIAHQRLWTRSELH